MFCFPCVSSFGCCWTFFFFCVKRQRLTICNHHPPLNLQSKNDFFKFCFVLFHDTYHNWRWVYIWMVTFPAHLFLFRMLNRNRQYYYIDRRGCCTGQWFNEYCIHLHLMEEQTKRFVKLNKVIWSTYRAFNSKSLFAILMLLRKKKKKDINQRQSPNIIHTNIWNEFFFLEAI